MLYAIGAVILSAIAGLLYMLGRSHGRSAEREAYHDATEAYQEHLAKIDAQAQIKETTEKEAHAQQAQKALDTFDEKTAQDLIQGAGVVVKAG